MESQSRTKETIQRIQDLRKSGAAKKQDHTNRRTKTRQASRDAAIRKDQE